MTAETLSEALSSFAATRDWKTIPEVARDAACTSLLDQMGTILAGSAAGGGVPAFIELARESGDGPSTVVGCGFRTSAAMAALANGAMAHAVDYEDTHDRTLVHPNAAVVPAALAVAEKIGASGRDLVTAIVAGAEIACRLGMSFAGNPQKASGFFVLPMCGAYGAAAAAGRLLGLGPAKMTQAFALTLGQVSPSSAVVEHGPSHFRQIRDGFNAKAGVVAAFLAKSGVIAFDTPFEGPKGFFGLFAGGAFDPAAGLEGLGERYEMAQLSYKPWPSCRGSHAFVEAALVLRQTHSFAVGDIVAIDAKVSSFFEPLCIPPELRKRPPSAIAAKFSIPFTVGVALAKGRVRIEDFGDDALRDPAVLRLASMVTHEVDGAWPHAESTRGRLTIRLADGRSLTHEVAAPLGHPERPIGHEALVDKFVDCGLVAAKPRSGDELRSLAHRLLHAGEVQDVSSLAA
ncbi:MAG: MmgE/PrpD family protein [Rhizobiaceae bacterium]|nr:MmgE/PrpD family protein [Rhizobiaceae bacterium]